MEQLGHPFSNSLVRETYSSVTVQKLVHPKIKTPKHKLNIKVQEYLEIYAAETQQPLHKCMTQH